MLVSWLDSPEVRIPNFLSVFFWRQHCSWDESAMIGQVWCQKSFVPRGVSYSGTIFELSWLIYLRLYVKAECVPKKVTRMLWVFWCLSCHFHNFNLHKHHSSVDLVLEQLASMLHKYVFLVMHLILTFCKSALVVKCVHAELYLKAAEQQYYMIGLLFGRMSSSKGELLIFKCNRLWSSF